MRRFILPLISVLIGLLVSRNLKYFGLTPIVAKLIAVAVVIVFIALIWRKRAAV